MDTAKQQINPIAQITASPKTLFQQNPMFVTQHRSMLELPTFDRSTDAALLEYQARLAAEVSENPQLAAFAGLKACGALEFLRTLKMLGVLPTVVRHETSGNLNHKA